MDIIDDDEQGEVLRIRLWNPQRSTALLAEFHAADRVPAAWAGRPECDPVTFEVTFCGGHTVRGVHRFFHRGKRRCLFATHVRKILLGAPLT